MSDGVPSLLMPPLLNGDFSETRRMTPPPSESPLPRTPRPQRFLSPPKTPLARFQASFRFTPEDDGIDTSMLHAGMAIARPDSACSNYSTSSNSSVDSNTTHSTTGGSCTSVEDDDDNYFPLEETPKAKFKDLEYVTSATSERQVMPTNNGKGRERVGRRRKSRWTESMDAHLWRTYALYQQDPKITPFFVLLGHVPPLGVCYKVAREAKRTWKDGKRGDYKSPLATPKAKLRTVQPIIQVGNRGDLMRQTSRLSWPASESSTRRRLRELCRDNYGLSSNPYHNYRQQRRSSDMKSRSPSPVKVSARDPFSSTRSMALSLTTSTSTSMRPSGALASLSSGREIPACGSIRRSEFQFGGISERISGAHNDLEKAEQNVLATGSLGLGLELSHITKGVNSREGERPIIPERSSSITAATTPSLLPPLELRSTKTPYATWPRRLKRPDMEDEEIDDALTPLPPNRRARRSLCELFDSTESSSSLSLSSVPPKPRSRTRGYTISAGTNPFGTRRRPTRPSAPLLTVTGPVSYEGGVMGGDMGSPLSKRDAGVSSTPNLFDRAAPDFPRRLGSPFMLDAEN